VAGAYRIVDPKNTELLLRLVLDVKLDLTVGGLLARQRDVDVLIQSPVKVDDIVVDNLITLDATKAKRQDKG
jgi:hypothetical protein